jgi:hypothetical protein
MLPVSTCAHAGGSVPAKEQASAHPTAKAIGHRFSLASFMRRAIKQTPNCRKRFIALLIPLG